MVSLSGGKDSTAMLLMMLERKMPVDIILFCDTGLEFPDMYKHLDEIEKYIGRKITRLKAPFSFEYYFLHTPVKRKNKHYNNFNTHNISSYLHSIKLKEHSQKLSLKI